jgi:hypothetical protein
MAEKSKNNGEYGEKMVSNFLSLIGVSPTTIMKGVDVECNNNHKHKTSIRERNTHGVDFIYHYSCPLINDTQQFVLVSSKFNEKYTNPVQKFKGFLNDLAMALECFKDSPQKKNVKDNRVAIKQKYSGVVFWLDGEATQDDMIEKLTDLRIDKQLDFDTIHLVDNKRIDFIFAAINNAKNEFDKYKFSFIVPATPYNSQYINKKSVSDFLPVQYINTSVLALKMESLTESILILNSIDEFDEDHLLKLVNLSHLLNESWAQKIYILFPSYSSQRMDEKVRSTLSKYSETDYTKKIVVNSYNKTIRND